MNYFYFIASVVNAPSHTVMIATLEPNRPEGFVKAARILAVTGFDVVSLHNTSREQYHAALRSAPLYSDVSPLGPVATISPTSPV